MDPQNVVILGALILVLAVLAAVASLIAHHGRAAQKAARAQEAATSAPAPVAFPLSRAPLDMQPPLTSLAENSQPSSEWRDWLWTYASDGATVPMPSVLPAGETPPAPRLSSVPTPLPAPPASADGAALASTLDERTMAIITQVYREAIQVRYDASLHALSVTFTACSVRSQQEVALAASTLLTKVRLIFGSEVRRSALLLDVTGLQVAPVVQAEWDHAFESFLAVACLEGAPGQYMLARYAVSDVTQPRLPIPVLARASAGAFADINLSPSAVFRTREEAVRYLADLRQRSLAD